MKFLRATPNIEEIELHVRNWSGDFNFYEVAPVPACIITHLKEVTFNTFDGCLRQVRLADFFLTHAVRLERMIGLARAGVDEDDFWDRLKRAIEMGDLEVKYSYRW